MSCRFFSLLRKLCGREQSATTRGNGEERKPSATITEKDEGAISLINGHEWVDLGLSVKWATCNIGADNPSDYGDYFAWGEITTKSEYAMMYRIRYGMIMGNICGDAQYDAATAHWGGSWRLPSMAEIEELINMCTWIWTTQGGHNGYKVTGKKGKSIFLPAAGSRYGTSLYNAGTGGYYRSGTPHTVGDYHACRLYFDSGYVGWDWNGSCEQSVRPVSE